MARCKVPLVPRAQNREKETNANGWEKEKTIADEFSASHRGFPGANNSTSRYHTPVHYWQTTRVPRSTLPCSSQGSICAPRATTRHGAFPLVLLRTCTHLPTGTDRLRICVLKQSTWKPINQTGDYIPGQLQREAGSFRVPLVKVAVRRQVTVPPSLAGLSFEKAETRQKRNKERRQGGFE